MSATDRIKFEQALIDALPMAAAVFDHDQRLCGYNAAFAALWRLAPDWLAEWPTLDDILERLRHDRRLPEASDFRAYKEQWAACFDTDAPLPKDLFLPSGETLRATFGSITGGGLVVAFDDRTERLAAERGQHEAVAVQRAALNHLADGIAVIGSDGRLDYHNTAFQRLWNIATTVSEERPHLRDLLLAFDISIPQPISENSIGRLMSRTQGTESWTLGDERTISASHVPLPDGATLLHFADTTATSRNTTALQERAADLAAVARLKSTFLAHLSSELRTPLNTISGFAQLLAGNYFGELNKRQREYSDGIVSTVSKTVSLLSDIVDFASIEAGLMTIEKKAADLHAVLVSVLTLVDGRARERKVGLNFDCSTEIGWVDVDANRLKQALLHLLHNAVTFTPAGGRVTLAARDEEPNFVIKVCDTGLGIPKADQERILEPFERGTAAGGDYSGAGLGLSMVSRLIALHGGEMKITSRVGRGTTVICSLPRVASPEN